jgi:hypothetical protein
VIFVRFSFGVVMFCVILFARMDVSYEFCVDDLVESNQ